MWVRPPPKRKRSGESGAVVGGVGREAPRAAAAGQTGAAPPRNASAAVAAGGEDPGARDSGREAGGRPAAGRGEAAARVRCAPCCLSSLSFSPRLPQPPTMAFAVPTTPTLYMLVVHWMQGMTAASDMAMQKRHAT